MANEGAQSYIRNAAGLAFKNALTGRVSFSKTCTDPDMRSTVSDISLAAPRLLMASQESVNSPELSARWRDTVEPATKEAIKNAVLRTLGSPDRKAGSVAAQAVAAIASIELPQGEWPDLIGNLLSFVGQENTNLRIATLQCVGFICEVIVSDSLYFKNDHPAPLRVLGSLLTKKKHSPLITIHLSTESGHPRNQVKRDSYRRRPGCSKRRDQCRSASCCHPGSLQLARVHSRQL